MRKFLISWMYVMAGLHLFAGLLLAWGLEWVNLDAYHATVLADFFQGAALDEVKALDVWWLRLFGATLQNLGLLMLLLVYLGNRYRTPIIWGVLSGGLLLWAPQDIAISLQRNVWLHLWVDLVALISLLPALTVLWLIDRKLVTERK